MLYNITVKQMLRNTKRLFSSDYSTVLSEQSELLKLHIGPRRIQSGRNRSSAKYCLIVVKT